MNTEFGHSVGDSVLLALARRIVRLLPAQDTLARLQGDSFAVMVLSESNPAAIEQMTRELLHTVKAAISVGERDVFMTASVGIAPTTTEGSGEEQVRRAEAAVYQAKRYGGDYVQFYEPAFGMRSRRIDLDAELRKALEAGTTRHRLPANRPPGGQFDCRIRGADPLGASAAWAHPDGRSSLPPPRRAG